MEAPPSGTGVFYQAMPATGADGKKIMKLIPVQVVNGQFVQTHTSKTKADRTSQKAVSTNTDLDLFHLAGNRTVGPSAAQQWSRKEVSHANVLSKAVAAGNGHSLIKQLQQTVNHCGQLLPMPVFFANPGELLQFSNHLPVTVKSPALPRGQYLQIPPNAQVRTVPATELPLDIKKQIFPTQETCSSLPTVVYVSPVSTVSQGAIQPRESTSQSVSLLAKDSSHTTSGVPPTSARPHLKLIPKVSQRPNSPTRWVVEEVGVSAAVDPEPCDSLSVTSLTHQTVTEKENSKVEGGFVFKHAGLHLSDGPNTPTGWVIEEEDQLAALNDKPPPQSVTSEILQTVGNAEGVGSECEASTESLGQSGQDNALVMFNGKVFFVAKKCSLTRLKRNNPSQVDEVIDLCEDDAQEDCPPQAASALTSTESQPDEDTVIFVSYHPPTSQFGPTSKLLPPAQDKERVGGCLSGRSPAVRARSGTGEDAGVKMKSQAGSFIPQLGLTEEGAGPGSSTPQPRSQSQNNHRVVSPSDLEHIGASPSAMQPGEGTDQQLRRVHGVTAEVQVCLRRVDEAAAGGVPSQCPPHPSRRSQQDDEEPGKELCPHEPNASSPLINVPHRSGGAEQEVPASPHTHLPPVTCSRAVFAVNLATPSTSKHKCPSSQTLLSTVPCDTETEALIGYMEPIDENFLSTYESDGPAAEPHTASCTDVSTSMRRLGRTRKRTICPCCSPAGLDPARKSVAQLQKDALSSEQVSRKGAKTKTPSTKHTWRLNGSAAQNKQNCRSQEAEATTAPFKSHQVQQHEAMNPLTASFSKKEGDLELVRSRLS